MHSWMMFIRTSWILILITENYSAITRCSIGYFPCVRGGGCFLHKFRCDDFFHCEDHSDEINCEGNRHRLPIDTPDKCPPDFFKCTKGGCLEMIYRCDGYQQCGDGSDELNCINQECPDKFFDCMDHVCIPTKYLCNVVENCKNGRDELHCKKKSTIKGKCADNEFTCAHGTCLSHEYWCDGYNHCGDNSDEENCGRGLCPKGHIPCKTDGCYKFEAKCDGNKDCSDGSDEINCSQSKPGEACPPNFANCLHTDECFPPKYKCNGQKDCVDGTDELNCNGSCAAEEFPCKDGGTCIPFKKQCDGENDCADNSDEMDCNVECPSEFFTCNNSACVKADTVCDGTSNCEDGSDESNCNDTCPEEYFKCHNSIGCIKSHRVCDRVKDCYDGSDEIECIGKCPENQFLCDQTRCVPDFQFCDGKLDCVDGTDEMNCEDVCKPNEFGCYSGGCIPIKYVCDGFHQCGDLSDESNCSHVENYTMFEAETPCAKQDPSYFQCKSKRCISIIFKCDGIQHCEDGEDEVDCKELCKGFFLCETGGCIDEEYHCDGIRHCFDGSDEKDCGTEGERGCKSGYFKCGSGGCIPIKYRCDNYVQCSDGSDEMLCRKYYKKLRKRRSIPEVDDAAEGCPEHFFQCSNGECLLPSFVCDGLAHCSDGDDEKYCLNYFPGHLSPRAFSQPDPFQNFDTLPSPQHQHISNSAQASKVTQRPDPVPRNVPRRQHQRPPISFKPPDSFFPPLVAMAPIPPPTPPPVITTTSTVKGTPEPEVQKPQQGASLPSPNKKDPKDFEIVVPCDEDDEFTCADGMCIDLELVCNNVEDCKDKSDEKNCESKTKAKKEFDIVVPCDDEEFRCKNGMCIPIDLVCDGTAQCEEGSDEQNCKGKTKAKEEFDIVVPCDDDEFRCKNGMCIPIDLVCDGNAQCEEGSDEQNCQATTKANKEFDIVVPSPCDDDEFRCKNGMCIPIDLVCDGTAQCEGKSDEQNCGPVAASGENPTAVKGKKKARTDFGIIVPCVDDDFRCANGICLSDTLRCDGTPDCPDGADEQNCLQSRSNQISNDISRLRKRSQSDGTSQKECKENQFRCDNGICIHDKFRCDGRRLCPDGSDEMNCTDINVCPAGFSKCKDGGCIPMKYFCDGLQHCVDNSDESNCYVYHVGLPFPRVVEVTPKAKCKRGDFQCDNGNCISLNKVCDGSNDCSGGIDELHCFGAAKTGVNIFHGDDSDSEEDEAKKTCEKGDFQCADEKCIHVKLICNGLNNCEDGVDEENCYFGCKVGHFLCTASNQCLDTKFLCNGVSNCPDGTDEKPCFKIFMDKKKTDKGLKDGCKVGNFQCGTGQCMDVSKVCNQESDCDDGTDENSCFNYVEKNVSPKTSSPKNIKKENDADQQIKRQRNSHSQETSELQSTQLPSDRDTSPKPARASRSSLKVKTDSQSYKRPTGNKPTVRTSSRTNDECPKIKIDNGTVQRVRFKNGTNANRITCGKGFVTNTNQKTKYITCKNGHWEPEINDICRPYSKNTRSKSQYRTRTRRDTAHTNKITGEKCPKAWSNPLFPCEPNGNVDSYHWLASLWQPGTTHPFCYGALINSQWILTSTTCLRTAHQHKNKIFVSVGDSVSPQRHAIPSPSKGLFPADVMIVHPDYSLSNKGIHINDIGLLRLNTSITFFLDVQPLCIDPQVVNHGHVDVPCANKPKTMAFVAGWNYNSMASKQGETRKEIVKLIGPANCSNWKDRVFPKNVKCAVRGEQQKSFVGHFGSPLYIFENNRAYLLGILSWSDEDLRRPYHIKTFYYTDIGDYIGWIIASIERKSVGAQTGILFL